MQSTDKLEGLRRYHTLLGWLLGVYHQQRALEYVTKRKSFATSIVRRAIDQVKKASPDPRHGWKTTVHGDPNIIRFLERACSDLGFTFDINWRKCDKLARMETRTLPKIGEI
jgi:hypothetical protein